MTLIDAVLALLGLLALIAGWQQRLTASAGTLVGFVAGFLLGRLCAVPLANAAVGWGLLGESGRPGIALAVPLALGTLLAAAGCVLGIRLRQRITSRLGRGLDASAGALTSAIAFVLIVWLAAGWVRTTPLIAPNRWAAESGIVAALDRAAPVDSAQALGSIGTVLADSGFPQVFSGQAERIRDIGAPNEAMNRVGRAAEDSVVKITTDTTVCSTTQEGSGWVFRRGYVATNAHVVAGSRGLSVQVGGKGRPYAAHVVGFSAAKDVAVLRVPEMGAEPLELGGQLRTGSDAVVVGFPENGPYTISPARVREGLRARGLDIYDKDSVVRDVYSLRAVVRPGNSGGPLVDARGRAAGMVFAKSAADGDTGYALTLGEISGVLKAAGGTAKTVSTGSCAASSQSHAQG